MHMFDCFYEEKRSIFWTEYNKLQSLSRDHVKHFSKYVFEVAPCCSIQMEKREWAFFQHSSFISINWHRSVAVEELSLHSTKEWLSFSVQWLYFSVRLLHKSVVTFNFDCMRLCIVSIKDSDIGFCLENVHYQYHYHNFRDLFFWNIKQFIYSFEIFIGKNYLMSSILLYLWKTIENPRNYHKIKNIKF